MFTVAMMISRKGTGTTFIRKRRVSQYEEMMKSYSQKHTVQCKVGQLAVPVPSPLSPHITKTFPTGSSYDGNCDVIGMCGYGEFTFPNGVLYRGEFKDGMFHGIGELVYMDGPEAESIIRGNWEKGFMEEGKILFDGTLEYEEEDWKYCKLPDRRYAVEYEKDLLPAGESHLTPDVPPRPIPHGFYDTGNGFFNTKTKVVYNYENILEVNRAPSSRERKWILDNCRSEPVESMGPRPDFYETWLEPELELAPLPEPLVGFKRKSKYQSAFDMGNLSYADKPAFYDSTTMNFISPPRKFQPAQSL